MKLLEVIELMQDAYNKYGNINLYVCKFSKKDNEKYYWLSSAFNKDDKFILGFNPEPFDVVKPKVRGKKHESTI